MPTQPMIAASGIAVLLAGSLLTSLPAQAADASATVQVTGVQFSASSGLHLQWLPDSLYQRLFAESREAGGLGGNQLANPTPGSSWTDQQLHTATAHAGATAMASAGGLLDATASASRHLFDPVAGQPHRGLGAAQQSGWFQLSGAGSLTITVAYQLDVAAPLGDGNDSFAGGLLQLQAGNLDTGSNDMAEVQLWSFELPGGSASRSGSLQLVVDIADPLHTGFYDLRANADVSAVSSVPEPGAWALMALGLVGLGARARRRSRAC